MKKLFFVLLLIVTSIAAFAQSKKEVRTAYQDYHISIATLDTNELNAGQHLQYSKPIDRNCLGRAIYRS